MELKDFRKFILESPITDKLRSLKITLNYPHLNSKIELEKAKRAIFDALDLVFSKK